MAKPRSIRNLVVILGDQLNRDSTVFNDFDATCDLVWMAEAASESIYVWSHKQRIAIFLSAMRHFRNALQQEGIPVDYTELGDTQNQDLFALLQRSLEKHKPNAVKVVLPGSWRIFDGLKQTVTTHGITLQILDDRHFYTTPAGFQQHSQGRKSLRMEYFYRELRKRFNVLMDGEKPAGGSWNFDQANRGTFGKSGPDDPPTGPVTRPDELTQQVLSLVDKVFPSHPGTLDTFHWPVTPKAAQAGLKKFIEERLPSFGAYQDAMWTDEPWLYHSWISSALNLKLLDPREVIQAAVDAYASGHAPIEAVEGFVRQILGWREYVRGVYWNYMPDYLERNAMNASEPLPDFYWTGATDLSCLKAAIDQTLEYGYAHHIQRLMVTGLYGLLLGVNPKALHEWYLAVYVDAIEWVELPNTLGMSQYADGGIMASKPYVASGQYINRMSNYCKSCPKDPAKRTGDDACPFTTLYWDYLIRHEEALQQNHRMGFQLKNLKRLEHDERKAIQQQSEQLRGYPAVCNPDEH